MKNIIEKIKTLSENKKIVLIGIDGPCASGKTTLAGRLADATNAQVIHADDFFLPHEMKTPERMAQAGGNIHYERFFAEVASGINSQKPFEYGVYSCSEGIIAEKKTVIPKGVIIVEGSYSLHPEMGVGYDLKIFVEASEELRIQRICERNGEEALEVFKSKWIPLENRYFEFFGIKNQCKIIV